MTVPPVYPRPIYIYALVDPETDEVRYIGQTLRPKERLGRHLAPCFLKRPSYKNAWLRDLVAHGLKPILRILEEATTLTWGEAERRWIAHYRAVGARLTNLTDGGDGTLGYVFPAEVRARLSQANRGQVISPEARAKIAASSRGRVWTPQMRAKLSRSKLGHLVSPEQRTRQSATRKARPCTPQERQAFAERMKAVRDDPAVAAKREAARIPATQTPEFRAKISATQKGRPKSPEHRAKIGAAHKGRQKPLHVLAAMNAGKQAAKARRSAQREAMQSCLFTNLTEDA